VLTKEKIEQRLAKLKAEREQLLANLNAYNGAIQDCEYWLGLIDQSEAEVAPDGPEITE